MGYDCFFLLCVRPERSVEVTKTASHLCFFITSQIWSRLTRERITHNMFVELLQGINLKLIDAPVHIEGQIAVSFSFSNGDTLVKEASDAAQRFGTQKGYLKKTELLSLWRCKDISFGAKCLVTLWWGKPSHLLYRRVYSSANMARLQVASLESAFDNVRRTDSELAFKEKLDALFKGLSRGGIYHLDGVDVTFFTKFIHFYFAANPPEFNQGYLPVIADEIMRSAIFAEMWDRKEDLSPVFKSDATIISYTAYTDKVNEYATEYGVSPFVFEDVVFNKAKSIGKTYVGGYNMRYSLPHWIAGRYNEKEQMAIVFNNLKGETYLFEGPTASLWREFLKYDYEEGFRVDELCANLGCTRFDLMLFMNELTRELVLVDHKIKEEALDKIKKSVNAKKKRFLKSSKGIGNFHAAYESVDNDYRNRLEGQSIPFAGTIELTYACNEACIHCYNPKSPREGGIGTQKIKPVGEMAAEEYFPILDNMAKLGVVKLVLTGGDPFMKKDFMKIVQYAHKLKFALSVYTNGQALYSKPELYDELRKVYPQYVGLSLYSTIPTVHDSITRRKGSCEKTMVIARRCHKDALGLQIKCPIMQANKDSYGTVYDFAMSVNGMPQFDVNITSSVDGDCFASERLRLTEEQLRTILLDERIPLSIENGVGSIDRLPEMCFCGAGDSSFNIQPDGTLSPCPAFPLNCGNVSSQDFEKIWKESTNLHKVRGLRYKDSDKCGKEKYCRYCNRCIGQSYVEHGKPENYSSDNCFLAKIRCELANNRK